LEASQLVQEPQLLSHRGTGSIPLYQGSAVRLLKATALADRKRRGKSASVLFRVISAEGSVIGVVRSSFLSA
jgi:hypothetical protein